MVNRSVLALTTGPFQAQVDAHKGTLTWAEKRTLFQLQFWEIYFIWDQNQSWKRAPFQLHLNKALRVRSHDQNFIPLLICNKIVALLKINAPSSQINIPPCQSNEPPSQINVPQCEIDQSNMTCIERVILRTLDELRVINTCAGIRVRIHDQNFVPLIIYNKIVTLLKIIIPPCQINVPPCQIYDPQSQINVPHCQINVPLSNKYPKFWDRIKTQGTFICKRVTYLCPFLTMWTGPKAAFTWANKTSFICSNSQYLWSSSGRICADKVCFICSGKQGL